MPTAPVHHGCAASQAITSTQSACSCSRVLVREEAVGLAAATDVHPHAGVAVTREPGHLLVVAGDRAVVEPVGHGLEHRGHRIGVGVVGQPDPRGQPGAVAHGDEETRADGRGARKRGDGEGVWSTAGKRSQKPVGRAASAGRPDPVGSLNAAPPTRSRPGLGCRSGA